MVNPKLTTTQSIKASLRANISPRVYVMPNQLPKTECSVFNAVKLTSECHLLGKKYLLIEKGRLASRRGNSQFTDPTSLTRTLEKGIFFEVMSHTVDSEILSILSLSTTQSLSLLDALKPTLVLYFLARIAPNQNLCKV